MGELRIGEVVLNNGIEHVVIDFISYEDMSSCSYDRKYKIAPLCEIENLTTVSEEEFNQLGYWVVIKGIKFPHIERVEDVAPYDINVVTMYKFRQRQAKTITVYE